MLAGHGIKARASSAWRLARTLMLLAERYFSTKMSISWRNVVRVMGFSIKTAVLWRNSSFLSKLLSFYDKT